MKQKHVVSLLVLSALFLASCGGGSTASSSSSGSTSSSGSSSSSSSSIAADFTVTAATTSNGSVSFDKSAYKAGEKVTITVTPAETYYLASITTDDASITPSSSDSGLTYTFTMPSKNVVVTAKFDNAYKVSSLHKINWGATDSENIGGLTLEDGSAITTDTTFKAGTVVTLKILHGSTWSDGFYYENTDTIFLRVNDETYMPSLPKGFNSKTTSYADYFIVSFDMPSEDVDIYLTYNNNNFVGDTGYKVTVIEDDGVKVLGYNPSEKKYSNISLFVLRPENSLVTLQYQYDGETDWTDLGFTFDDTLGKYFVNNIGTAEYLYLSNNITIKASAKTAEAKKITYVNADKVTITSTEDGKAPDSYMPGERFHIVYKAAAAADYVAKATITGLDEDKIRNNDEGEISFDMPDGDVTITFNVETGLNVTFADNADVLKVAGIRRSLSDTEAHPSAAPSSTIYLLLSDISIDTGKMITGAKMNDGEVASLESGYSGKYIELTMPASGDAAITILTADAYNVTLTQAEGGNLSLDNDETEYASGSEVSGSYYVDSQVYSLTALKIANAAGEDKTSEITDLVFGDYSFSFTMPSFSVTITPTWTKAVTYTATIDLGDNSAKFATGGYNRSYIAGLTSYGYQYFPEEDGDGTVSFIDGEKIKADIYITDSTLIPTLIINDGTNSTSCFYTDYSVRDYTDPVAYEFTFENDYVVNSDITISFTFATKAAVTATIDNPSNIALDYVVNGESATDFSSVKELDTVSVSTTAVAPEGKSYGFKFLDATGKEMTADYDGNYLVTGDFKLEVLTLSTKTLTIVNENGYYCTVADENDNSYESGASIPEESTIRVGAYDAAEGNNIHVLITVGGVTIFDKDSEYFSESFKVTGDVVITITAAA